jgi:undecaprenyl-diphosphatase
VVLLIVLATAVSGVLALLMKRLVESANTSLVAIGAGFLVTSAALVAAELIGKRVLVRQPDELGWPRTVAVAVAQACATLPGVSRSGLTITGGMIAGLTREAATRFSFLLGIPIIAAAATGYAAIAGLLAVVRRHTLYVFSVYTALVGLAVIAWGLMAG